MRTHPHQVARLPKRAVVLNDGTHLIRQDCCNPTRCRVTLGIRCCTSLRCACEFPATVLESGSRRWLARPAIVNGARWAGVTAGGTVGAGFCVGAWYAAGAVVSWIGAHIGAIVAGVALALAAITWIAYRFGRGPITVTTTTTTTIRR